VSQRVEDYYEELLLDSILWKDPVRKAVREEDIQNMATSFVCHGQIEPIVVKPTGKNGLYEGVVGRLRYEGAKHANRSTILARVHQFRSDSEVLEWQLAENLHRVDLSAIDKAEAYRQLYEIHRETVPEAKSIDIVSSVAKSLEEFTGERPAEKTIFHYLKLASDLPEETKNLLTGETKFGVRHGLEILRLKEDPAKQQELVEKTLHEGWTVQKLKREVDAVIDPKPRKPPRENIDLGFVFDCKYCNERYKIIHIRQGEHRLQKVGIIE
jgi:ParB family chromosome partitioning protein